MASVVNHLWIRSVLKRTFHITRKSICNSHPLSTTASSGKGQKHLDSTRQLASFSASVINTFHSAGCFNFFHTNLHSSSLKRKSRCKNSFSTFTKSEYIHPLSQIVLEHLQSHHSEWLKQMGLETGLEVRKDGTFVLRFPGDGRAQHGQGDEAESIWTMYEPVEKKHYLCITKNKLVGRYFLQDNTKPAWHSDKKSTPERVQYAVNEMVEKVKEMARS